MNKEINSETLKLLFSSYKPYVLPILMLIATIVLVFSTFLPQLNGFTTTLSQRNEALRKLQVLRNNLAILTNAQETEIDSQLAVSLRAFPQTKDFESILTTISSVAANSGVALGNFEFRVGDLSKDQTTTGQFPALTINLIANTNAAGAAKFMTNLATSLPLSEVKSVDVNGGYTNFILLFYYKSVPVVNIPPDAIVAPLSIKQKQLLDEISSWEGAEAGSILSPASLDQIEVLPEATVSATP